MVDKMTKSTLGSFFGQIRFGANMVDKIDSGILLPPDQIWANLVENINPTLGSFFCCQRIMVGFKLGPGTHKSIYPFATIVLIEHF